MTLEPLLYPALLSPYRHGRLVLRNRILHASMTTRRVHDCAPTPQMIQYYANRARGGAALIVSEPLNCARFQTRSHYVRVWNGDFEDELKRWSEAVEIHDCRLLGQIQDSGRGRHERGRNPDAVGASALPDDLSWTVPYVLTDEELGLMIDDFAAASRRLARCGFSGVELSAGHGHLFHQFMSPWSNQRPDRWGGDFEGRLRLLRETIVAIRASTPPAFLIGLKLPGDDGVPGGIGPCEARRITAALTSGCDVDYVVFCQGSHARTLDWHVPDMHWPRAPWMPLISELRVAAHGVPVAALGLITDPAQAEGILARDEADLIALGRALTADPAWPLKSSQGREQQIRHCVSCNTCWGQISLAAPLVCDNNPRLALPDEVDWHPPRARTAHKLVIVGSGIAGLEAAWIAAERGHEVVAFGASSEVGGKTRLHSRLPGGESLSSIYDFQFARARRAGVRFELGMRVSAAEVLAESPDQILLATGAEMSWPSGLPPEWQAVIPDLRTAMRELIGLTQPQGGTAVLFDADHTEGTYSAAQVLRRLFDRVILVTSRERVAVDVPLVSALGIYRRLSLTRIEILALHELCQEGALEQGELCVRQVYTGVLTSIPEVALLTYATPRVPQLELLEPLQAAGCRVRRIGDCRAPRGVLAATSEGHAAGLDFERLE